MTLLITILGAVGFFALIIASVLAHELGHFLPAKRFGIKVTQFFAGFGPTIWSTRRGETEYGFKWIPFGGFCKLIGMYPPRGANAGSGRLQRLADSAREAEAEDIAPGDREQGRLFYQQPIWQRLIVMAGGICTNLLLAFLLFWGVFGLYGHAVTTTTVAQVSECMIPAGRPQQTCQPGDAPTPAVQAGLQAGDTIVEFNGHAVTSWSQLADLIRANRDAEARLVVLRGGQRVPLTPVHTVITGVADRLDPSKTVQAGFLGYVPRMEQRKAGPAETLGEMWGMSAQALYGLATLPIKTVNIVVDLVEGHPRDPNSPMSIVGASRVAGDVAANSELSLADKVAVGASLLGGLNLFLFWLNVVPLPPMDGGHIAGALWEALKRGVARARRRPDPGPVDTAKMLPVAYVVGGLLLLMGVVLVIADIISPVKVF